MDKGEDKGLQYDRSAHAYPRGQVVQRVAAKADLFHEADGAEEQAKKVIIDAVTIGPDSKASGEGPSMRTLPVSHSTANSSVTERAPQAAPAANLQPESCRRSPSETKL
jgi:hypothetical protein